MARVVGTPRPFWHLVEASFSEASFLWGKLDAALDAHNYVLAEVHTWVEDRLHGALDGVRLARADAIEPLLVPALKGEDHDALSVAAYLLSAMATPRAERALEYALRAATPETALAWARGLGRAGRVEALRTLWQRTHDASPTARAAVLAALSFCGFAPEVDWLSLLASEDASLRHAAADALRFAPARVLSQALEHTLVSADSSLRVRALCAGVAAGDAVSWQRCIGLARSAPAQSGPLLALVALLGGEHEHAHLLRALELPSARRDALWALGFAGTVRAAETCLAAMQDTQLARIAAEAFCAITGLDLARENLIVTLPEAAFELPALEDDDLDANLVPSAEEDLPHPDLQGVAAWWAQHKARFYTDVRYLSGRTASFATLRGALDQVATRRRHALALALSARTGGAYVLQPWAFTRLQRSQQRDFPELSPTVLNSVARGLGFARLESA